VKLCFCLICLRKSEKYNLGFGNHENDSLISLSEYGACSSSIPRIAEDKEKSAQSFISCFSAFERRYCTKSRTSICLDSDNVCTSLIIVSVKLTMMPPLVFLSIIKCEILRAHKRRPEHAENAASSAGEMPTVFSDLLAEVLHCRALPLISSICTRITKVLFSIFSVKSQLPFPFPY
jgi:hypothetical protein